MKKRMFSIIVAVCLIIALPFVPSQASQMLCFTGVNDTLLPLRDSTMPAYFGTTLYVPASVFTEFGISSGMSTSQDTVYVYRGEKIRLTFFISLGLVMDQDGITYENSGLQIIDGVYFLPLDFICGFFDLSYKLLSNDPVSVLRIKNSSAVYNDNTFIGNYKSQIEKAYKSYSTPLTPSPTPIVFPTTSDAPPTETPIIEEFSDVTVYLSFFDISEPYTSTILDTLADHSVTACFFLSAPEIIANPALVRRISGEKHMIGIMLDSVDYSDYSEAAKLLFEATKLVTPLVASNAETADEASAMCGEYGLIYRAATVQPGDDENSTAVAAYLSITPFTSDDLRLACTQNTTRLLPTIIRYLETFKYTVSIITETSPRL